MEKDNAQKLIIDSIKFGFHETFGNIVSWLIMTLKVIGYLFFGSAIAFLVGFVLNIILNTTLLGSSFLSMISLSGAATLVATLIPGIALILIYLPSLILGTTRTYLQFFDMHTITFRPLFDRQMIFSYVIAQMICWCLLSLYVLACNRSLSYLNLGLVDINLPINISLILLVVPGFFIYYAFMFTTYYIVDKNLGPIAAIEASWKLSFNNLGTMLGAWIIITLVNIIPFIGVLVSSLMSVYLYRTLETQKVITSDLRD